MPGSASTAPSRTTTNGPPGLPPVTWSVAATDREMVGFGRPVIARRVIGRIGDVAIRMVVVLPADATGPVPLLVMFGRDAFPAPSQPSPAEIDELLDTADVVAEAEEPAV